MLELRLGRSVRRMGLRPPRASRTKRDRLLEKVYKLLELPAASAAGGVQPLAEREPALEPVLRARTLLDWSCDVADPAGRMFCDKLLGWIVGLYFEGVRTRGWFKVPVPERDDLERRFGEAFRGHSFLGKKVFAAGELRQLAKFYADYVVAMWLAVPYVAIDRLLFDRAPVDMLEIQWIDKAGVGGSKLLVIKKMLDQQRRQQHPLREWIAASHEDAEAIVEDERQRTGCIVLTEFLDPQTIEHKLEAKRQTVVERLWDEAAVLLMLQNSAALERDIRAMARANAYTMLSKGGTPSSRKLQNMEDGALDNFRALKQVLGVRHPIGDPNAAALYVRRVVHNAVHDVPDPDLGIPPSTIRRLISEGHVPKNPTQEQLLEYRDIAELKRSHRANGKMTARQISEKYGISLRRLLPFLEGEAQKRPELRDDRDGPYRIPADEVDAIIAPLLPAQHQDWVVRVAEEAELPVDDVRELADRIPAGSEEARARALIEELRERRMLPAEYGQEYERESA